MPIYEFYCQPCHTIYSFRSPGVNTAKVPACPKCGQADLRRRASTFAISKGRKDDDGGKDPLAGVDEAKMEKVFASLAGDMEGMNEDDPRQAARLMRKLYDAIGVPLGEGVQEAIRRMESGEDPEAIEHDLGDVLEAEDPMAAITAGATPPGATPGLRARASLEALRRRLPARVDDRIYDL